MKTKIFVLLVALAMMFIVSGVALADGPPGNDGPPPEGEDWVFPDDDQGSGEDEEDDADRMQDDGPVCSGSTEAERHAFVDFIYGRSEMTCTSPATLQSMSVKLIRCKDDFWFFFFCLDAEDQEHLDAGVFNGPGSWEVPVSDEYYVSNVLRAGHYRVITRHTVTWPGGAHTGTSGSGWIEID